MSAPEIKADIKSFLAFADVLADAARPIALRHFRQAPDVDNKLTSGFDPVTQADRDGEAAMRALVLEHFPDHGMIGEEFGIHPSRSGYSWVFDPIDGTRAFIAGLPLWGVLIALAYEGQPLIGVIDQPFLGERFKGCTAPGFVGATLTNREGTQPLKTRACASLGDAVLSSTDNTLFKGAESDAFGRVRAKAKLTRYGYDCYAYAMLAAGHMDCVIESGLQPYDVQALIPVIRAAGGGVCAWDGGDAAQGGRVLAWGDQRVRDEAIGLLAGA